LNKLILLACLIGILTSCSKKTNSPKNSGKDNESYAKARECRDSGHKDSAFIYYNSAKIKYKEVGYSLGVAQSLINMGRIQTDLGDYYGGIESLIEANSYSKDIKNPKIKEFLPGNYNTLGMASARLGNHKDALRYYLKALPYSEKKYQSIIYNNMGDSYSELGNYKEAIKMFHRSIEGSDSTNFARVINNLATAKFKLDDNYNPIPEYRKAIKIRIFQNDPTALNSSYASVSNYYLNKNKDSALFYAKKMLVSANSIKNPDDQLQALRKIIHIDKKNSSEYLKRFFSIHDSVNNSRYKAKNQFALIRADIAEAEAKNKELALNNLEKDNQAIYTNSAVGILCFVIISSIIYYKKRKELAVRKTELKYSKKVHDVVANGVYQIMTKIENHQDISRNETLDELEEVYNRSRNIAYDSSEENLEDDFSEKIRKLASYFKNEHTETYLAGNDPELWANVSTPTRSEIYNILREMLVNMKKHSKANRVILQFKKEHNRIGISYKDNGIGIQKKSFFKKGLQNAVSRIENINGDIIFDTETEKGLKINFSFPIS
jgi:tetratricopeptide (TPR) repeat protein